MNHVQTPARWLEFYKTAAQFRDLAPWRWFYDGEIFGVKDPETRQIGWCSIMGRLGEHFALGIYRGADGLESFWNLADLQEMNPTNPEYMNMAYGQNCWMIAFGNAAEVSPEHKKHLKALDLSFRGAGQWIVAESFDPGFMPWFLKEKDLPFLTHCLEQAMTMAYRKEENPDILDQDDLLIRTPKKQADGKIDWVDKIVSEDELPETSEAAAIKPSPEFLKKIKAMPQLNGAVVLCNFMMAHPIQEKKTERPWYPMMLLGVEPGSGIILTQDMFPLAELADHVEPTLLNLFKAIDGKPKQLGVHNLQLSFMLETICEKLDIELVDMSGDEPYFTDLMETFSQFGR